MEKFKKELKTLSILILILVGFTLVRTILDACVNGIPQPTATQGLTKEALQIVAIISFALGFVFLLPQVYLGLKGMKIADGASFGKAPFVWVIILGILAVVATVSALSTMFNAFNLSTALAAFDCAIDVFIYIYYFICIRKIAGK